MIVMKFGGSSVGNAGAIAQVADIVASYYEEKPVVVVSALQGVTDRLIAMARGAARGETASLKADIGGLSVRHNEAVRGLMGTAVAAECIGDIDALFSGLERALQGVASAGELTDRSLDLVVSFGERLSAPIVAAAFRSRGIPAESVDARELIVTDDRFTAAEVNFFLTGVKSSKRLLPMIEAGQVPVVTGFIGATLGGVTTTLGRGGSDYSATILGGALAADEIWIWKEVDGIMTADPGIVADAALLSELSYDEAAEMSYFGAKVLHPKSMIPAIARGIPVRMRNTFRPAAPGTVIGPRTPAAPFGVKVVTAIKKLAVVNVEGKGMMGIAGFAAHVFGVAGRLKINILMFSQSSSEQNICLVIEGNDASSLGKALEEEFHEALSARLVDAITVMDAVAAVAVVGQGMCGTPGIAAKLFGSIAGAGVNVLAIAQGSSERNISFVIPESDADAIVRAVHAEFRLHEIHKLQARSSQLAAR